MTDLSEHNRKKDEKALEDARKEFAWNVSPDIKMPDIHQHGLSFAEDVNATFVNQLSQTQLLAVLGAYEAGKL